MVDWPDGIPGGVASMVGYIGIKYIEPVSHIVAFIGHILSRNLVMEFVFVDLQLCVTEMPNVAAVNSICNSVLGM